MILLIPLIVSFALVQAADAASAGQDPPGTSELRGRVTDKETGLAIARAVVELHVVGRTETLTTLTDDEGRYEFVGLRPAQYEGFVSAGESRATHLMQPLRDTDGRRSIALEDGEVRKDVNIALPRALAMTVRVIDEWGEPLSGLRIALKSAGSGREVHGGFRLRTTDDRGRLRLFALAADSYVVCAEPEHIGSGAGNESSRRDRFLRTCYPSAVSDAEAEPVRLERSDLDDLEIRMRRGGTFTISGIVLDASGAPAPAASVGLGRFTVNGSASTGVRVGTDGRFTVANITSGDYAIHAEIGGPHRPEHRRDLEAAFHPVRVDSSDVEGLVVSLARAVDVTGRFVLEDPAVQLPRPPGSPGLFVSARLAGDRLPGSGSFRPGLVGEDRIFTLTGMFGKRTIDVANVPRGWYVKSIRYGDKEIVDVPTEFKAGTDPAALEILLSRRGAVVTGRVLDERGVPSRGARVLMLPADQARWSMFQLATATASGTGAFRIGPQRGGDYLIIALPPTEIPDPGDRVRLARLAASAERITLSADEERTVDLRVAGAR